MKYKRIHVRVPINGEALLSGKQGIQITAQAIDISQGGLAITAPDNVLQKDTYDIIITTRNGGTITLTARLVRQTESLLGFQTVRIDDISLQIITDLVHRYQETPDFIKQIEEHNLFEHFVDEDGNEIDVTFDIDPEP